MLVAFAQVKFNYNLASVETMIRPTEMSLTFLVTRFFYEELLQS